MKLEPYRVGGERSARQSRPLDRAFALLDPMLARPALVVESNDALGRAAKAGAGDRRPAGLCRSTRRYGGRWCVIPASPIAQHPPKNRLAVELTRRELCSDACLSA